MLSLYRSDAPLLWRAAGSTVPTPPKLQLCCMAAFVPVSSPSYVRPLNSIMRLLLVCLRGGRSGSTPSVQPGRPSPPAVISSSSSVSASNTHRAAAAASTPSVQPGRPSSSEVSSSSSSVSSSYAHAVAAAVQHPRRFFDRCTVLLASSTAIRTSITEPAH